jgi:hypothetical protein
VKIQGEFTRHRHADEFFLVLDGVRAPIPKQRCFCSSPAQSSTLAMLAGN